MAVAFGLGARGIVLVVCPTESAEWLRALDVRPREDYYPTPPSREVELASESIHVKFV